MQLMAQQEEEQTGMKGGPEVGCLPALKKDQACWHIWLKLS